MISCDEFHTQYARAYHYFLMWADVNRGIFDEYGISTKEVIVEIIIQLEIFLDIGTYTSNDSIGFNEICTNQSFLKSNIMCK